MTNYQLKLCVCVCVCEGDRGSVSSSPWALEEKYSEFWRWRDSARMSPMTPEYFCDGEKKVPKLHQTRSREKKTTKKNGFFQGHRLCVFNSLLSKSAHVILSSARTAAFFFSSPHKAGADAGLEWRSARINNIDAAWRMSGLEWNQTKCYS